ncbi:MAG TPA: hypothetical protein VFY06_12660 [Verrucomicrobiae bacterium]|nr:hypothetical protein [Verrucomicrobiae bacterium]
MKELKVVIIVIAALTWLASAAMAKDAPAPADPSAAGKKVCETVSLITGVAISPLMGVGAVGAYEWFKAKTPEQKAKLPWFANPLFWVPALVLVIACFVKDSTGVVLPPGLKKPFDAAETVEHKISGLVATGAFVPIAASIFHSPDQTGASLASLGFAAIDLHWLYNTLMIPVCMIAFFFVFLASNAIQILILISPFGVVDAALKSFRTALIGSIAVSSLANPWIGAAWALVIILISYLVAGWSFRLSHFGLAFIWDFFTRRKNRFRPDPKENKLFLAKKCERVPARTYGRLSRNDKGELVLNYRPWLVLPQRTLVLPPGDYETGRGVFYSEIVRVEGDSARTMLLLPPRYLGHEGELARIYNFAGARDIGLRAAWAWFKSLFTGRTELAAETAVRS